MGQAIALLAQHGSRRIAASLKGLPGPPRRKAAFTQACITLVDALTVPGGDNVDAGFLAVRRVSLPGDALVATADQCAHGAIRALGDSLVQGRDMLVVGCDCSAIASSRRPLSLTSIDRAPSCHRELLAVDRASARARSSDGNNFQLVSVLLRNSSCGRARDSRAERTARGGPRDRPLTALDIGHSTGVACVGCAENRSLVAHVRRVPSSASQHRTSAMSVAAAVSHGEPTCGRMLQPGRQQLPRTRAAEP